VIGKAAHADLSKVTAAVLARVARQRRSPPVSVWSSELWRAHRLRISTAAAVALAASIAAIALVRPFGRGAPTKVPSGGQLVSIDDVDFAGRHGMVLQSGETAIIWLSQERSDR
jgi:hypothetical protein